MRIITKVSDSTLIGMPFSPRLSLPIFIISVSVLSCRTDHSQPPFQTENVVIVIIDGPRYSETWGDESHSHIPQLAGTIAANGFVCEEFYNKGPTYTASGNTAITTGFYQEMDNTGLDLPQHPSLFQYFLRDSGKDSTKAWIVASKDKLEILGNCSDPAWSNRYLPSTDCGLNGAGVGSGHREDSLTYIRLIDIFETYHPNLLQVDFREPDYSAHQGDWSNYLKGIEKTDQYVAGLWAFLQSDKQYANRTTLFVTNDHGRHLDTVSVGFSGHGDSCDGCRHINFFAIGPDLRKGVVSFNPREQIDVAPTVAYLLGFKMNGLSGQTMLELIE